MTPSKAHVTSAAMHVVQFASDVSRGLLRDRENVSSLSDCSLGTLLNRLDEVDRSKNSVRGVIEAHKELHYVASVLVYLREKKIPHDEGALLSELNMVSFLLIEALETYAATLKD